MKRLIDLETDKEFAELSEILSKVRDGHVVATMRQAVQRTDGSFAYIDVQQSVAETKVFTQVNGGFFYLTLQNLRRTDVRQILTMFQTVLQRGTQNYKKQQANDYFLTIDLVRNEIEKGVAYALSAASPIFASGEGSSDLMLVFEHQNIRCEKAEVSLYDVEYEKAIREESSNKVYAFGTVDDEEAPDNEEYTGEEFVSNEEILDNSKYSS